MAKGEGMEGKRAQKGKNGVRLLTLLCLKGEARPPAGRRVAQP